MLNGHMPSYDVRAGALCVAKGTHKPDSLGASMAQLKMSFEATLPFVGVAAVWALVAGRSRSWAEAHAWQDLAGCVPELCHQEHG